MPDTHTTIAQSTAVPTGAQIYDALMAKIEPELLSGNIPHLDEPYADETPAQRTARYERYEQAYVAYDDAYSAWLRELSASVQTLRRTALRHAESMSKHEETGTLHALETELGIASLPPSA